MGTPADGPAVARALAWSDPAFASLGEGLGTLFSELIAAECLNAGCIEDRFPSGNWSLAAVGASLFITDEAAKRFQEARAPRFAVALLSEMMAGRRDLHLGRAGIARANAEGRLNLFVIGFGVRPEQPSPEGFRILLARAIEHYVRAHEGYHLAALLREDAEPVASTLLGSGMRSLARFTIEDGPERVAMMRHRTDAMPLFPDSLTARFFAFSPPIIGFSDGERRLLLAALEGHADPEIAAALGLSQNTVKRVWRTIYERCDAMAPHVLEGTAASTAAGVRGAEKRRHLVAYLRDHPSELRPYAMAARLRTEAPF